MYRKGTNNKWTYDLADYLMVDWETIIALAFMHNPHANLVVIDFDFFFVRDSLGLLHFVYTPHL